MKKLVNNNLVRIKKYSSYGGRYTGKIGRIVDASKTPVPIRLRWLTNKKSKTGVFYFASSEFELVVDKP